MIRGLFMVVPLIALVAAVVLQAFALGSSTKPFNSTLKNLYLLKIEGSGGNAQFGPLGYCHKYSNESSLVCSSPGAFAVSDNIESILTAVASSDESVFSEGSLWEDVMPSGWTMSYFKNMTKAGGIVLAVGIALTAISLVVCLLTCCCEFISFVLAFFTFWAAAAGIAAAGILTAIYYPMKHAIADTDISSFSSTWGTRDFAFLWVAAVVLAAAWIWIVIISCCSACCSICGSMRPKNVER